ncbi:Hypothetical protein D9617_9g024590 [Elsinoe fawcettii]|nr:Hypothetical protein D9617_9g024590 [Elsinoe fawcettii]
MFSLSRPTLLLLAYSYSLAAAQAEPNTCQSFGIDFQDEGSYFQNASSPDPFTFVSVFDGCQPDLAQNLLVDPEGNEVLCTDTSLTPDNVDQLSTCPTLKNQLVSGEWSVLIISNNGNGTPIAYERDLYLTVGVPTTITTTPTITITATTNAVINETTTISEIDTETVTTTITTPRFEVTPTVVSRPRTVVTETKTLGTVSKTSRTVIPTYVTVTETASCTIPEQKNDKPCRVTPTMIVAAAMMSDPPAKRFRPVYQRGVKADSLPKIRAVPADREQRLQERRERLAEARKMEKRSPDSATMTVTDSNTANYPVVTSTVATGTSTMTITAVTTSTSTVTETETCLRGRGVASAVTITKPTRTLTRWRFTVVTEIVATRTHLQHLDTPPQAAPKAIANPASCTVKSLDHLVLTIKDIRATIAFYASHLGTIHETFDIEDGICNALHFGNQKINLHFLGDGFAPTAASVHTGSADLCFITEDDVEAVLKKWQDAGIEVLCGGEVTVQVGATRGLRSIYCRDPDGNLVE